MQLTIVVYEQVKWKQSIKNHHRLVFAFQVTYRSSRYFREANFSEFLIYVVSLDHRFNSEVSLTHASS